MSSLLPPNRTPLEAALSATTAVAIAPEVIAGLWTPASCPAALLPWLAWAMSVDDWDPAWTVATQRQVVAESLAVHRRKGTVWAVKHAIAAAGDRISLTEWFQQDPPGVPHTALADVEVSDRAIDTAMIERLMTTIGNVKPVRAHITLRLWGTTHCALVHAAAIMAGHVVTVYPWRVDLVEIAPGEGPRHAIGLHTVTTVEIKPA